MDRRLLYWIWLRTRTPVCSPVPRQIMDAFDEAEEVYAADREKLSAYLSDVEPRYLEPLCNKDLSEAERILDWCRRNRTGIVTMRDWNYPEDFRLLHNPPLLLFYFGRFPDFNRIKAISVVGTRRMSDYGKRMCYEITYGLGRAEFTVVSGMALGIDAVAAAGALMSGSVTVAVLGSGIGRIYPKEHAKLYSEIARRGAVLSEYLPMAEPDGIHFPQRNRLIAALGQGLVVMEAGEHSGALITARMAEEIGKKVFVLPGNADEPNSIGTNFLAKQGACVVTSAYDIMDGMGFEAEAALVPRVIRPAVDVAIRRLGIGSRRYLGAEQEKADNGTEKPEQHFEENNAGISSDTATEPEKSMHPVTWEQMNEKYGSEIADVYFLLPEADAVFPEDLENEQYSVAKILSVLSAMEIDDLTERLPDGKVRRKK